MHPLTYNFVSYDNVTFDSHALIYTRHVEKLFIKKKRLIERKIRRKKKCIYTINQYHEKNTHIYMLLYKGRADFSCRGMLC